MQWCKIREASEERNSGITNTDKTYRAVCGNCYNKREIDKTIKIKILVRISAWNIIVLRDTIWIMWWLFSSNKGALVAQTNDLHFWKQRIFTKALTELYVCCLYVYKTAYVLLVLGPNCESVDGTSTKLWMLRYKMRYSNPNEYPSIINSRND